MAWSTPTTYVTGQVLTAANLNTYLRDNSADLDRRTNAGSAFVAADEGTTSTTYTDLASAGPAVSATVGANGVCIVCISSRTNPVGGTAQCVMSYAISGATSGGASDSASLYQIQDGRVGVVEIQVALTPGINTFTAKYRTSVGAVTAHFSDRHLVAFPLSR